MKKLILLIAIILFARENPFKPVLKQNDTIKFKPEYFRKIKVYLPSDARILKEIVFVYQSVSSDIKEKRVKINKDIDFHSPIYIRHFPKTFSEIVHDFGVCTFYAKNKKIFIKTRSPLLRKFFLVKPFRIVLDFQKYNNFYTKEIDFNSFVKKVIVGSHTNYFRVVIYLDSNYKFKISKEPDGVKIELY